MPYTVLFSKENVLHDDRFSFNAYVFEQNMVDYTIEEKEWKQIV